MSAAKSGVSGWFMNDPHLASLMRASGLLKKWRGNRDAKRKRPHTPEGDRGLSRCWALNPSLMVPEQRQQKNDRQRHADQPKQCASTETHSLLLCTVFPWSL